MKKRLIAYVSDEMYVALADVQAEWELVETGEVSMLRSSTRGAFYADLSPGIYSVSLAKDGYGSKTARAHVTNDVAETPIQFRLLSDGLIGYAWPKWVRAGQSAELRIHAIEQYQ